ncbi:MAG: response regulator [Thermoleophilia bacterium]|nr:response regulator [Thermoleophilia bacterium]
MVRLRPLVVAADDEPDALRLVELCLTRADFAVMTASDGEAALGLIRSEAPDACVLDVAMPRMTGLELTRLLRADAATAGLPVLLLTAAARLADETAGREAGADAYLTKPFAAAELVARVRDLIAGRAH